MTRDTRERSPALSHPLAHQPTNTPVAHPRTGSRQKHGNEFEFGLDLTLDGLEKTR
jgi:hypothetical protein